VKTAHGQVVRAKFHVLGFLGLDHVQLGSHRSAVRVFLLRVTQYDQLVAFKRSDAGYEVIYTEHGQRFYDVLRDVFQPLVPASDAANPHGVHPADQQRAAVFPRQIAPVRAGYHVVPFVPFDQSQRASRHDVVHPQANVRGPGHETVVPPHVVHGPFHVAQDHGLGAPEERPLVQHETIVAGDEPTVAAGPVVQRVDRDGLDAAAQRHLLRVFGGVQPVHKHVAVIRTRGDELAAAVDADLVHGDGVRPQLLVANHVALEVQQVEGTPVGTDAQELRVRG